MCANRNVNFVFHKSATIRSSLTFQRRAQINGKYIYIKTQFNMNYSAHIYLFANYLQHVVFLLIECEVFVRQEIAFSVYRVRNFNMNVTTSVYISVLCRRHDANSRDNIIFIRCESLLNLLFRHKCWTYYNFGTIFCNKFFYQIYRHRIFRVWISHIL